MPISVIQAFDAKGNPEGADFVTPKPSAQSNPYAEILDATRDALVQRARNYRALVVIVSRIRPADHVGTAVDRRTSVSGGCTFARRW